MDSIQNLPPSCQIIQSVPINVFLDNLRKENSTNADYISNHRCPEMGELSPNFAVVDGLLLYRHKCFLTPSSPLKHHLLHEFHSTPIHGHGGVKKMLVSLSSLFYWPNMLRDVEIFVRACATCQQVNNQTAAPVGLL